MVSFLILFQAITEHQYLENMTQCEIWNSYWWRHFHPSITAAFVPTLLENVFVYGTNQLAFHDNDIVRSVKQRRKVPMWTPTTFRALSIMVGEHISTSHNKKQSYLIDNVILLPLPISPDSYSCNHLQDH